MEAAQFEAANNNNKKNMMLCQLDYLTIFVNYHDIIFDCMIQTH